MQGDLDRAANLFAAASLKHGQGNLKGAIEDYGSAIQLNPKESMFYLGRGRARMESGDLQAALEDMSKAIELEPSDHHALLARAKAYQSMGRRDEAKAEYEKVLRLDRSNSEALAGCTSLTTDLGSSKGLPPGEYVRQVWSWRGAVMGLSFGVVGVINLVQSRCYSDPTGPGFFFSTLGIVSGVILLSLGIRGFRRRVSVTKVQDEILVYRGTSLVDRFRPAHATTIQWDLLSLLRWVISALAIGSLAYAFLPYGVVISVASVYFIGVEVWQEFACYKLRFDTLDGKSYFWVLPGRGCERVLTQFLALFE